MATQALCAFGVVCAGAAYRKARRGARAASQGHVVTGTRQDLAGTDAAFQQGAAHEARGQIEEAHVLPQLFWLELRRLAAVPLERNRPVALLVLFYFSMNYAL